MPPNIHDPPTSKNVEQSADKKEVYYKGFFYDVTEWVKRHPGGKIIEFYTKKGEDATLPIQEFHNRSTKKVSAIMNSLKKRPATLEELGMDKEAIQRHEALTRDFQKLKDELVAEGLFEPSIPHVVYRISELIAFLVLGIYLLTTSQSWIVWTFGLFCFAMYQGRSGWLMHEGGHHSLTGNPKVDRFLQAVIYGLGDGMASKWWSSQHNRHHAMPQFVLAMESSSQSSSSTDRMRKHRTSLTEDQRIQLRERDRLRKAAKRKSSEPVAGPSNLLYMEEVAPSSTVHEPEDPIEMRRQSKRIADQQRRADEDPEATNRRRTLNAARQRQRRDSEQVELQNAVVNTIPISELDESVYQEHYCGEMNSVCAGCGAISFKDEFAAEKGMFTYCCQRGKVSLPAIRESALLKSLMTGNHPKSKHFMENIRSYNSSLAFASMGAQIAAPPGYGPYCFRIHGQIYHRAGTLHPDDGQPRKFAQLYILDPSESCAQRLALTENSGCDQELMLELSSHMAEVSPYASAYKMLHEVEVEAAEEATRLNVAAKTVLMTIRQDRNSDLRRYNAPRANEVAIIFQSPEGDPPLERDLLIHLKVDQSNPNAPRTKRVSILDNNLEPMTYPVFFPFGDQGWGPSIPLNNSTASRTNVTQMQYFSYRFAVRGGFNPYLSGGKLTQQFFVDAYVKTEANRLNYIIHNQKKLRTELYKGLVDHINSEADTLGITPGKPVILPSSFQGSPRNMAQSYQDAMAIVRYYGKPDFFITMTCNPKWKEITDNIEPYQSVENRPDVVARVFRMKLTHLLKQLKDGKLLGKQIAKVHVIEFQKRGLPHAHILLIVANDDKPNDVERIDNLVSAELPDPQLHPRLFELVKKHMVHGPCGAANLRSPCMDNAKCTKDFPKQFNDTTIANAGGYPKYRRRNDGLTATVGSKAVDNRWIVPYNPRLLLEYNCHINVEVCATVKSVKYLFKYVYKGHDRANIGIEERAVDQQHNEVNQFTDFRYVSPPEAAWRLFSFRMHDQSHTIVRLHVHLENEQSVTFNVEENMQDVIERAESRKTTLTAWFKLNEENVTARSYFYHEIPHHFVYKSGVWVGRQRGGDKVIGRMYAVNVTDVERYCLRLLLLHVKGAKSFEDIKTVNGQLHDTFQKAAVAMKLLDSDETWDDTLAEAVGYAMPRQLRQLFATICVFGSPSSCSGLWGKYQDDLAEDFNHQSSHPKRCPHCLNLTLHDIQDTLRAHGKKCQDYGLPIPTAVVAIGEVVDRQHEEVLGVEMLCSLNDEQFSAFDQIYAATKDESLRPKCFFLDGVGGSGKTYLYKALISILRGEGRNVLSVASTGIAANLLPGGRTHFSMYKLPVPLVETSTSSMRLASDEAKAIREANLLIWDESTMGLSFGFSAVDRLLKEIMTNDCLFGGKVMLLGGDFRQTLPVVIRGSRADIVGSSLRFSTIWDNLTKLSLIHNLRSIDPDYSQWLLKLGNGELLNTDELPADVIEIPEAMVVRTSLVNEIFGSTLDTFDDVMKVSNSAILCPTNQHTHKINQEVLDILSGQETVYYSCDTIDDESGNDSINYPVEFLNGLRPSGMPPHELKLKVGAIIMLLRNLNTKRGLCNGTRLIVQELSPNLIKALALTGSAKGEILFIPRIHLSPTSPDLPFVLRRKQFPVTLAFAMTINKSQGQTLDMVGIFLPEPVFSHGQLYVAFSRVRRSSDVKVYVLDGKGQGKLLVNSEKVFTKNVVYHEVLC